MSDLNSSSARIFASFVADEPDAAALLFHRYLRRLCRLAQTRLSPRLAQRLDPEDVVMSAYRSFFVGARAGRFWIQESGDLWALLTKITLRKLEQSVKLIHSPADRQFCTINFDDLLLMRLIGKGGMGKVCRAVSRSTGQPVAVKFLHKSLQNKPDIVERFLEEAAIVQRLNHSSIVRVEGIGRTNAGVYFIVMELLEGRNLATEIAAQIPSISDAVKWIIQVAEAMQHAHQASIIHCDLKPANVLLTQNRNVVVTDFGLARLASDPAASETRIAGTAAWMAPEQVDPVFGSVNPRTDIYGLGALLYSMLTGQPPFVGSRVADVLACVVNQHPVAPAMLRPEVSKKLERLCLECLSKNAADRPASAREFLHAMLMSPIGE